MAARIPVPPWAGNPVGFAREDLSQECREAAFPFTGDLVSSPALAQKDDGEKINIKGLC